MHGRRIRLIGITCISIGSVAVATTGCGTQQLPPCVYEPMMIADQHFTIDERRERFNPNSRSTKEGTVKITLNVPSSASRRHGIAIDGGAYNNLRGASVGPGRSISLTIALKPGRYTLYDPVGNNARNGFRAILVVTKAPMSPHPCKAVV